ncbi:MAG: DNA replication/repair protein RecF [Oscillospiraceae bacterium]|nr:DNA replication/repair protein RecF [Oscillospiraceae bacterium]
MIVRSIALDYFRSYLSARADFDPGMNVICGENAQGKTNLLEAVAYLSTAQSHRARYDKELIMFGIDNGFVTGEIHARDRDFTLEARLSRNARRQLYANGVRLKQAGELGEYLNTVLFCPEDLYLIRAGAAERRSFLDSTISQLRPRYADAVERYKKIWKAKSAILRAQEERPDLLASLDDFSLQMCQTGAQIIHYRAHFIRKLSEIAPGIHREFSGGREELGLAYETVSAVTDPLAPVKTIFAQLCDHMESHREAELAARQCLCGPHRDDLRVEIDGRSARQFASQGQTRTAALSLKLAQRDFIFDDRGEYPVLLLDDVLSELDPRRQEFVLNHIKGGQVFLTCCEEERLVTLNAGKVFRIRDGSILEEK